MPRNRMIEHYRLTPAAQSDLDGIWDYTARTWSSAQADTYLRGLAGALDRICQHPEIARERGDVVPPVRLHRFRSHLIIYRIEDDHIAVI